MKGKASFQSHGQFFMLLNAKVAKREVHIKSNEGEVDQEVIINNKFDFEKVIFFDCPVRN